MSMLAHLLVFLGGFIAPLIIWLIYKDRSALVNHHGKEQLNFQISLTIYSLALFVFAVITLGIGALIAVPAIWGLAIYAVIMLIVAGIAANNGEYYRIPLTMRLIK